MVGRKCTLRALFALALLISCAPAYSQIVVDAVVARVTDGDSVDLRVGEVTYRARLHGIDAPERRQPWGSESHAALESLVHGLTVRVIVPDVDRFGRLIVRLFLDDVEVNLRMLELGAAWHYTQFDRSEAYAVAERRARQERRGLWADSDPMPPWDWRRR